MSILIKGMEMPKNCNSCRLLDWSNGCCSLTNEATTNRRCVYRMEWCPLIELPPHGRLIDADALKEKVKELLSPKNTKGVLETMGAMFRYVLDAPTIIEAERENG